MRVTSGCKGATVGEDSAEQQGDAGNVQPHRKQRHPNAPPGVTSGPTADMNKCSSDSVNNDSTSQAQYGAMADGMTVGASFNRLASDQVGSCNGPSACHRRHDAQRNEL